LGIDELLGVTIKVLVSSPTAKGFSVNEEAD
jgi:hypothetical protein